MESYKVKTEIYNEYSEFKEELYKYIISSLFHFYRKDINSGDLIFTGSLIYDRLGIQEKKYFGDIDVSISISKNGDEVIRTFISKMNKIDLTKYREKYQKDIEPKVIEDNRQLTFDKIISIDIFRNEHPENCDLDLELYSNPYVYTKYFGHEWNLDKFYHAFQNIINMSDDKKYLQIIKFKKLFENYLKVIDINEFQDKVLYNNIVDIINS